VARVTEARAQLAVTRAAQFPQIDAQGSYTNERFSQKSFPFNAIGSFPGLGNLPTQQEFYRTGLDLSFELDLWGRLRRATEAGLPGGLRAARESVHEAVHGSHRALPPSGRLSGDYSTNAECVGRTLWRKE
jgi:multidrug efflux system outer membrane protein